MDRERLFLEFTTIVAMSDSAGKETNPYQARDAR